MAEVITFDPLSEFEILETFDFEEEVQRPENLRFFTLEEQLFELNLNTASLQNSFYGQLAAYAPESGKFKTDISINFVQGEVRDFCFIDIYIDGTKYIGVMAK